jgi:O-antigen/teichoic acid export membrane protein
VPSLLNAIRRTWPFTLATVFIAAYFNGGALLVSFAASDTEVGVYGAAFGLYAALTGLSSLLMKSVMPDLAAGAQSPAAHRALGRVIFGGLAVPGLAAAVAPEITRLLLGDTFAPVAVVLTILCAGAMASYVAAWFVYVLYASGRERDYAAVVGIALLAFVLLGLPMAQRWAARGVAGALAATEVLGRSAARAALAGSVWGVAAAMSAAGAGAAARAMALPSPAVVALAVVVATLVSFPGAKALYLHPTPSAA